MWSLVTASRFSRDHIYRDRMYRALVSVLNSNLDVGFIVHYCKSALCTVGLSSDSYYPLASTPKFREPSRHSKIHQNSGVQKTRDFSLPWLLGDLSSPPRESSEYFWSNFSKLLHGNATYTLHINHICSHA